MSFRSFQQYKNNEVIEEPQEPDDKPSFRSFQEYLNSKGNTDKKAIVDITGDQIDVPKQKAKEDPQKMNKSKGEQRQVKEAASTTEYEKVKKHKTQYTQDGHPQVKSEPLYPITGKTMYTSVDGAPQVKEYLDEKGNLIKKVPVEGNPDYHGSHPAVPEKAATSGKGWKSDTSDSKPHPYQASGIDPGQRKGETGLGDLGMTKYEPDTKLGPSNYLPGGKAASSWPKQKVETFLDNTKDMSLQEFTKYVLEGCSCQSDSVIAIKHMAKMASDCPVTLETFVHEVKRHGALPALIEALMDHRETFTELTNAFEDKDQGEGRSKAFARAMNEAVGPPMGLDKLGDLDDEDLDDEDEDEEDEEDEEGHPHLGDEEDDLDLDDEEGLDDEDMGDEDDLDLGDEEDKGDKERPLPHGNLLKAMAAYSKMKRYMSR